MSEVQHFKDEVCLRVKKWRWLGHVQNTIMNMGHILSLEEESEKFFGAFGWSSLNLEECSIKLLKAFGWNLHSFKHKRRWYSWPVDVVQTKCWNPQCPSEGDVYGLWLAISYMWSNNGPMR